MYINLNIDSEIFSALIKAFPKVDLNKPTYRTDPAGLTRVSANRALNNRPHADSYNHDAFTNTFYFSFKKKNQ